MIDNKDSLISFAEDLIKTRPVTPYIPIKGRVAFIAGSALSVEKNDYSLKIHGIAKCLKAKNINVLCLVAPFKPEKSFYEKSESELGNIHYINNYSNLDLQQLDEKSQLECSVDCFSDLLKVYRPEKIVVFGDYSIGLSTYVVTRLSKISYIAVDIEGLSTKDFEIEALGTKQARLQHRYNFIYSKAVKCITSDTQALADLKKLGESKDESVLAQKEVNSFKALQSNQLINTLVSTLCAFSDSISPDRLIYNASSTSVAKKTVALIFTNLGLTTIDGSSVFIANMIKVYSTVYDDVVLLSAQDIGPNFNDRINDIPNLKVERPTGGDCKKAIAELESEHKFDNIFVRAWGDRSIWFDKVYSEKITYYWPLTEKPTDEDYEIFHSVNVLAFQTKELRDKTFKIMGEKKYILCPPLVEVDKGITDDTNTLRNHKLVLSYVGTLREECFSEELLRALIKVKEAFKEVIQVNIVIGKVYYLDNKKRDRVLALLDTLQSYSGVKVAQKLTQSECNEILRNSDISFSLWEPNSQNSIQVSTKMLDCLAMGCNVITFATPLHKKLLGDNYEFFINSITDIEGKLVELIQQNDDKCKRFTDNYMLSQFSLNWHRLNLINNFNIPNPMKSLYEVALFNEQFDEIYGVFINPSEKRKLDFLNEFYGLNIIPFQGVNGRDRLKSEYTEYCKRPLETEWEKRAQKKRLSIGAMGHLASFIEVCEDALSKGFKKILILESDVLFHKDAFSSNFLLRPSDFEVLYLGAGKWNTNLEHSECGKYYYPNQTTGTFAVAIDTTVIPELIKEWKKFVEPTDVAMWSVTDKAPKKSLVIDPNLIICDVATSLTGNGRSQREISKRFDWKLSDYVIHSVEYIDKYYDKIKITIDHFLEGALLKIKTPNGVEVTHVNSKDILLEVNDVVEEIEFENLFISSIQSVK